MDLAAIAAQAESSELPDGDEERFAGYGVMGLPFSSGHVLAMRRFSASSIGPGYTSVWHRAPDGGWTFWQDQPAELGCGRYFSSGISGLTTTEILIDWPAPYELRVTIPEAGLRWSSTMVSTWRSRSFNRLGSALPDRAWRSARLLRLAGPIAGRALGVGPVGLTGEVPNGQRFVANPQRIWFVGTASAALDDADFGPPGPLRSPARLGDFGIPQRGVFAFGRAFFHRPP
ncbi:MAG: hypothetical protein KDB24_13950 [Microthrixaceae bacterium]|nr:hypothetical protein [Microthrixaceae bacterium]